MSKKENFNQAMYEMFGVGRGGSTLKPESTAAAPLPEPEELLPEPEEPVARRFSPEGPELKVVTPISTYIAPGTRLEGTLRAEGSVEIDGEFKGDIIAKGGVTVRQDLTGNITASQLTLEGCCLTGDAQIVDHAVIDAGSAVNGNIVAGNVTSSGTVGGDMSVKRNLTLDSTAKVVGNVTTGTMTIARGAVIRGSVEIQGEEDQ